MIGKLDTYNIKSLHRISPSQYHSATLCPYKLVLANAFAYKGLLPLSANAHFGSIIHKMIELISKGVITEEVKFSENWISLITTKEEELRKDGLESMTPLKYSVMNFAGKKNQLRKILQKRMEKSTFATKPSSNKCHTEQILCNSDKSILGIADLIIENDFGVTIIDFKSGKVYSETIDESEKSELVIKREYEVQLKLYAYLYFLMKGTYPKSLFLVTLSHDFIEVKFDVTEVETLYNEALLFLSNTNTVITNSRFKDLAQPSIENCKFCSYRPACDFYSKWLIDNFENVNDLHGVVDKVNYFNNNSLGLELNADGKRILIIGLPSALQANFELLLGKKVILYNLKKTKQSLNATANNFTTVYEQA